MKLRYFSVCGLILLASVVAFFWYLPDLPARVPIHWGADGNINGWGSPWTLLIFPAIMGFHMALFAALPWLSPQRFSMESFQSTCFFIMLIITALMGYIFALMLYAALGNELNITRAVLGGVSVLIILLGNVLGKLRRNFFIGIRTPWTLASERVWYATHRLAGKLAVIAGVACLAITLAGLPLWVWMAALLSGLLCPALYSFIYYKQLEGRGELEVSH